MTPAQIRAELSDAESKIALLRERLADPRLLAGEDEETLASWREELARVTRHAAALSRRQELQP